VSGPVRRSPLRLELGLAALLAVATLLVWPFGAYAIEDDWAYLRSLVLLRDTGELRILDWNPMSLVSHVAWGWLATAPFGFSFDAARLSVLLLSFAGVLGFVSFLRFARVPERTVALAALALLFHPLVSFQAFLFATDAPALAWTTLALAAYARGLAAPQAPSARWLALGSLAACLGGGARQSALLVVGALGLALLLFDRAALRRPRVWLAAFAPPVAAVLAFALWYRFVHGPTETWGGSLATIAEGWRRTSPGAAAWTAYVVAAYTAFFALPLLAALPLASFRPGRGWRGRAALALCAAAAAVFAVQTLGRGALFPYLRNKLTRFGYWSPNEVVLGARPVLWGEPVAWLLGVLLLAAVAGLLLLASRAGEAAPAEGRERTASLRLLGCLFALQLAYALVTAPILFDRHLIALAPTALGLAALGAAGPARVLPFLACWLPLAAWSVAGTHDAHALSRAAFQAGEALVAEGVDPALIDAGYAFVGWHMYERSQAELRQGLPPRWRDGRGEATSDPWYVRLLAPRVLSRYRVTLSRAPDTALWRDAVAPAARPISLLPAWSGQRVVRELAWRSYWPWAERPLFVLEDPTAAATPAAE
jgi:hypothetical protein